MLKAVFLLTKYSRSTERAQTVATWFPGSQSSRPHSISLAPDGREEKRPWKRGWNSSQNEGPGNKNFNVADVCARLGPCGKSSVDFYKGCCDLQREMGVATHFFAIISLESQQKC